MAHHPQHPELWEIGIGEQKRMLQNHEEETHGSQKIESGISVIQDHAIKIWQRLKIKILQTKQSPSVTKNDFESFLHNASGHFHIRCWRYE